ncbi:MAG: TIGR04190 family B12-binding domain/radical SAM domain protein [Candidatus Bipolaricaulia bacterium]
MNDIDLLLLHPPSVYDFRDKSILYGPISDLIPSSTVFEMYPLGFLTMSSYLQDRDWRVRIVNLALRMLNDRRFDVPTFLAKRCPEAVGIDLHWLPHAHGALEIARLVKSIHPDVPVIMGGLSASYFHRELITYPQVDYVLRGDSVEPALEQLLLTLRHDRSRHEVPNLTWKTAAEVVTNPLGYMPASLDMADIRPDRMVEMVLRYRDLHGVLPFNGWWQHPITAVFTVKGCAHECVTCGSSNTSCSHVTSRPRPVYRSPANLVQNMADISGLSRGPIFLVGDLNQAGADHADEVLDRLRALDLPNEVIFEFFTMPSREHLERIDRSVRHWSIELSPESHDPEIRRIQDETTFFTNDEMERTIEDALSLRCSRVDVFFMIGLPRQTPESVGATVGYCEKLFRTHDERLSCFISPLGPFLDPGSRGFEAPEAFGYRLFARTLEEHRQRLVKLTWEQILNYETEWMTRAQLVEATYDAAERLNALKLAHGRISQHQGETVARHIREARDLRARLAHVNEDPHSTESLDALKGEISRYSISTVCDKRELFWRRHLVNFHLAEVVRIAGRFVRKRLREALAMHE